MKKAKKSEIEAELKKRREIGGYMSNILHNLHNDSRLEDGTRDLCKQWQLRWDAIQRCERK